MKLLNFRFTKISVEKLKDSLEKLKIENHIDISSVELKDIELPSKEKALEVKFSSEIIYNPEIAKLEFKGNIVLGIEEKIANEFIESWKDKKIPESTRIALLNLIFERTSLKALELEDQVNLPIHLPFPKLLKDNKQDKKDKENSN